MNEVLEQKARELEQAEDYACWYLVKQQSDFSTLAYLVSFLKEYQEKKEGTLQDFIDRRLIETNEERGLSMTGGFRALRVAAFLGLITLNGKGYEKARITETYLQVEKRCKKRFEKTDLYQDVIDRQIEKIFVSSPIDEKYQEVRKDFGLCPVMLLYKVLLELGKAGEGYRISMTEYRAFLATTKQYEDFLDTLLFIRLFRREPFAQAEFGKYKDKFDNRFIQALKQLSTLDVDKDGISLKEEKAEEVAKKVYVFEQKDTEMDSEDLIEFLGSTKSLTQMEEQIPNETTESRVDKPYNRIVFGAPGTGKSYRLKVDAKVFGEHMERVTFHPNYSYAQFVGTYKPVMQRDGEIAYQYVPGPFIRMYVRAWKQKEVPHLLLIEEINRAAVAAVFGEMFQLLDRENGVSTYAVHTSEDVREYLARQFFGKPYVSCDEKEKVHCEEMRLPDNLYIWATMNSADQGVQPMDTAFKRRWDFEYIGIDKEEEKADFEIPLGTKEGMYLVSWNELRRKINQKLSDECRINEDKLLGPFFLSKEVLKRAKEDPEKFLGIFQGKVLMYLFEDAAKMRPAQLFSGCERSDKKLKLSDVFADFEEEGEKIFGLELEHKEM